MADRELIRNFCIIAHIDHGKSTLADRLIEVTGAISKRELREQFLDSMDLERERGITIKLKAIRLNHTTKDGKTYELNLIDTPGHVDFTYEVSRSLAACEGVLLVIDVSQGVEAQTIANLYLAVENSLEILLIMNKIDLPGANIEDVRRQIRDVIGLDDLKAIEASAKLGIGTDEIINAIIEQIPSPKGDPKAPLRALIFDSQYDPYQGVISHFRIFDGSIRVGDKIRLMVSGEEYEVIEVGYFNPKRIPSDYLEAGQVGYLAAGIKNISSVRVGDTITLANSPATQPLPGYKEIKPVVFAGLYPQNSDDYDSLKDAIEKLKLNDSSLQVEPETSQALGFGFRCGFLGLLHMEIVQERLEREYGIPLLITAPSVSYKVVLTKGETIIVDNPGRLPPPNHIEGIEEPFIEARIFLPSEFAGNVLALLNNKKGIQKGMQYISPIRLMLTYELPLSEVITDFYDKLKSITRGYASLDYEFIGYRPGDLAKLEILINGEVVDALSIIVHREDAARKGRVLAEKLRKLVPRQLFEVTIQASVGGKIVARENVKPLRKNVTAKCYGGDITRKRKLLEKQKEGKKRMKQVGKVEIPQEAFMAVLRISED